MPTSLVNSVDSSGCYMFQSPEETADRPPSSAYDRQKRELALLRLRTTLTATFKPEARRRVVGTDIGKNNRLTPRGHKQQIDT